MLTILKEGACSVKQHTLVCVWHLLTTIKNRFSPGGHPVNDKLTPSNQIILDMHGYAWICVPSTNTVFLKNTLFSREVKMTEIQSDLPDATTGTAADGGVYVLATM